MHSPRPFLRLSLATLSLLCTTPSTWSKTQLGLGLATCAQFNTAQANMPDIARAFDAWITGYVSGINFIVFTSKGIDLLADESTEKATSFVKGYCSVNPSRVVTEGANEYWFGLANRAQRKP